MIFMIFVVAKSVAFSGHPYIPRIAPAPLLLNMCPAYAPPVEATRWNGEGGLAKVTVVSTAPPVVSSS